MNQSNTDHPVTGHQGPSTDLEAPETTPLEPLSLDARADYQRVENWVDIVQLEHRVLDFWTQSRAFDRLREKNANGKPWSFLDGPITANNPMGVHHAWGRSLKDAFQRYHAMNGRRLRYQNGFDCQGLWVEVEVEKEHGFTSKRDILDYGIDRFVKDCKARVLKYASRQTEQSIRLGYWMDWDDPKLLHALRDSLIEGREEHLTLPTPSGKTVSGTAESLIGGLGSLERGGSYFTFSTENNLTIWDFLKRCHARGKVYRGSDVMPWSGRSGTAYSQMEVIEGRKLVAHTAVFVKFPLIDRPGENLLVWTTTPWTLSSNVAAAVNADLEYVALRARHDGEIYYFAKDNLEFARLERQFKEKKEWIEGVPRLKTLAQIFNERGGYEIERTLPGSELVGLRYRGPFDELEAQQIPGGFPFTDPNIAESAAQAHRVVDGGRDERGNPMVVAGEGTGIVHTAPGCGDVDHVLGRKLGLPMIAPLDESARFLDKFGPLAGRSAVDKETVALIIDDLKQKGLLVAAEQYPHVYPHCWRSGDELVFRMVDEWYIRMDWRDEIMRVVDDIKWIPAYGRDRELEWLSNMRDWMISKKRFWGLALPIWTCQSADCHWFDVIGGLDELEQRAVEGWSEFVGHTPHRPWIDKVKIRCEACGGLAHRVEDVANPWLDAGIVPYSTLGYNTDREHWRTWFPADLVLECFPGQFRNWFYALLAMSTMMEGAAPFKHLLGHALVRDENGREMHKSTGNAIWFDEAAEIAGADVMRWLYARHDPTVNLNFGYNTLRAVRGAFINTLWNTYAFYANYARLADWRPGRDQPVPFADRPDFDRWMLTELQRLITTCRDAFEAFEIERATAAIEDFVEEKLSNWYVRHNRRRFWKTDRQDARDTQSAFETLFECVYAALRLCAPVLPFLTEAMFQNVVRGKLPGAPDSVHHTDYPLADPAQVDDALTAEMRAVMRMTSLGFAARDAHKRKVRQPLASVTIGPADDVEKAAAERFRDMLKDDLNVKAIDILEPGSESPLKYEVKPNFRVLGQDPALKVQMKAITAALAGQDPDSRQALLAALKGDALTLALTLADGTTLELPRDGLLLQAVGSAEETRAIAEERGTWVAIDTTLTPELEREGLMRDLLRRLQTLRKDLRLELEDRIALTWFSDNPAFTDAILTFRDLMATELLADRFEQLQAAPAEDAAHEIAIGKAKLLVTVSRV